MPLPLILFVFLYCRHPTIADSHCGPVERHHSIQTSLVNFSSPRVYRSECTVTATMATATPGLVESLACGLAKIAVTTSQVGNEEWEGPACTRDGANAPQSHSASSTPTKLSPVTIKKRFGRFSSKAKYQDQLGTDLPSPKDSRKNKEGIPRSKSHQTIFHHRTVEVRINYVWWKC